jgi:outer membrane protein OmpA-like peptidoglycan-associated protein/tetratricopeptide (TPR) repeat protein
MKQLLLCALLISPLASALAQSKLANDGQFIFLKNGNLLDEAVFYYDEKDYETALPFYKALEQKYPDDVAFTYRLGVCYMYSKTEANKSIEYLLKAKHADSSIAELNYQLGRAYYTNYAFDKASSYFTTFINQYPAHPLVNSAKALLQSAQNGKAVMHNATASYVVFNVDSAINTVYAEYAPLVDVSNKKLYYTMRGDTNIVNGKHDKVITTLDYNENIMVQNSDKYATPHSLPKPINSRKHDATLALTNNKLFIYRDKKRRGSGDFFEVLDNKVTPMKGLNTKAWEGSAAFFNEGKTVVFSSVRKHNVGGRDLYIATRKDDNTWNAAQLLSTINTELDEDAPYFDVDKNELYFSSKGHNTIGGYDVFKSKYSNGTFETPVNMGYPINSIADDIYYTKASATEYYFASNRMGGFGSYDIYKAYTTNTTAPYKGLAILSGKLENVAPNKTFKVYAQNPASNTQELVGNFSANEFDNTIALPLQSGIVYTIAPTNKMDSATTLKSLTVDLTTNTKQSVAQQFDFLKPIVVPVIAAITPVEKKDTIKSCLGYVSLKKAPATFAIKPIYFSVNSSKVSTEQEEYLKQKSIPQLEIMGYTDASGTDRLNNKLALRRAEAVASLLRRYGAKVKYWTVKGTGVYPNCTNADEKCRVVIMNPVWD